MEGRGTGSRGFERAANYVEERFRAAGLHPAGIDGFRQPVTFHDSQVDRTHTTIELVREGKVQPIVLGDQAAILVNWETPDTIEAGAVFIGYGLSVPEAGYDDLAGEDLKGKVAVLVRGGPTGVSRAHQGAWPIS